MRLHVVLGCALALALAVPPAAEAQLGQIGRIGKVVTRANQLRDLQMTDEEEQALGKAVSEKLRERYGVVQNAAVHRYVGLVGAVLAQAGGRPGLPWTFIVLDVPSVNAFAAPGGYIHITRGALGLIRDEAELAGVLGHEIIHVTEKHTIRAIQKSKAVQMGADETLAGTAALFDRVVTATFDNIVNQAFGRSEELESDEKGVKLANAVGYAPQGLGAVLTRIKDRNSASTEKRGAPRDAGAHRHAREDCRVGEAGGHCDRRGALCEDDLLQADAPHRHHHGRRRRRGPGRRRRQGGRREEGRGGPEEARPRRARQPDEARRRREDFHAGERLRRIARARPRA
jgi:predicted Zn-dependent protease